MVNEGEPSCTGEEETASPVSPAESGDEGREEESHSDDEVQVPLVLPLDDRGPRQVRHVRRAHLTTRLEEHPPDVRVPEP